MCHLKAPRMRTCGIMRAGSTSGLVWETRRSPANFHPDQLSTSVRDELLAAHHKVGAFSSSQRGLAFVSICNHEHTRADKHAHMCTHTHPDMHPQTHTCAHILVLPLRLPKRCWQMYQPVHKSGDGKNLRRYLLFLFLCRQDCGTVPAGV
jgi:hypothetical protein